MEDAYRDVKLAIEGSFGQFRDFDRGMRLNDVRQLMEIRTMIKDIPDHIITDFYYHIEDFLRSSMSVDELALHIRLVYVSISSFLELGNNVENPSSLDVFLGKRKIATLICCVSEIHTVSFQHLLEAVKDYTVNVSIIEWSGVSAVLLRIQKDEKGLDKDDLAEVLSRFNTLCKTHQSDSS